MVRASANPPHPGGAMRRSRFLVLLLSLVAVGIAVTAAAGSGSHRSAIVRAPAFSPADLNAFGSANWLTSGGGLTDNRYSTLNQINTRNIGSLKVAWHSNFGIPKA